MKYSRIGAASLLLIIFGGSFFIWQVTAGDPRTAWQSLLVNLLFFSAIAQSGPVFAAICHLTEARWGRDVVRVAIGLSSFLPASFALFVLLYLGSPYLATYSSASPARHLWFDPMFLITRDLIALAVLYSVSLVFSHRVLASMDREGSVQSNKEERKESKTRNTSALTPLAITVVGAYAVVFSLIGFDLVMALDQQWYSTLFGGYFFITSFYIGLAAISLTAILVKQFANRGLELGGNECWDLGKLVFAFCLLTAYFFWAQYLITWYANLPEEVGFFLRRFHSSAWAWLTWTTVALSFGAPFLLLLSRRIKQTPQLFFCVLLVVLVGMWLERYLLVVPSISPGPAFPGWTDLAFAVSFIAGIVFSYGSYRRRYYWFAEPIKGA